MNPTNCDYTLFTTIPSFLLLRFFPLVRERLFLNDFPPAWLIISPLQINWACMEDREGRVLVLLNVTYAITPTLVNRIPRCNVFVCVNLLSSGGFKRKSNHNCFLKQSTCDIDHWNRLAKIEFLFLSGPMRLKPALITYIKIHIQTAYYSRWCLHTCKDICRQICKRKCSEHYLSLLGLQGDWSRSHLHI